MNFGKVAPGLFFQLLLLLPLLLDCIELKLFCAFAPALLLLPFSVPLTDGESIIETSIGGNWPAGSGWGRYGAFRKSTSRIEQAGPFGRWGSFLALNSRVTVFVFLVSLLTSSLESDVKRVFDLGGHHLLVLYKGEVDIVWSSHACIKQE